jgi:hypothetical protein
MQKFIVNDKGISRAVCPICGDVINYPEGVYFRNRVQDRILGSITASREARPAYIKTYMTLTIYVLYGIVILAKGQKHDKTFSLF